MDDYPPYENYEWMLPLPDKYKKDVIEESNAKYWCKSDHEDPDFTTFDVLRVAKADCTDDPYFIEAYWYVVDIGSGR